MDRIEIIERDLELIDLQVDFIRDQLVYFDWNWSERLQFIESLAGILEAKAKLVNAWRGLL